MPESLQTQMAVLANRMQTLVESSIADRAANEKFREEVRLSQKETSTKLAAMQTSLDMAKGGWKVLAVVGAVAMAIIGATTSIMKAFGHA